MSRLIYIRMKLYPGVRGWYFRNPDSAYILNEEIPTWFLEYGLTLAYQKYSKPFNLENNEWGYMFRLGPILDINRNETGRYGPKTSIFLLRDEYAAMMFKLTWI